MPPIFFFPRVSSATSSPESVRSRRSEIVSSDSTSSKGAGATSLQGSPPKYAYTPVQPIPFGTPPRPPFPPPLLSSLDTPPHPPPEATAQLYTPHTALSILLGLSKQEVEECLKVGVRAIVADAWLEAKGMFVGPQTFDDPPTGGLRVYGETKASKWCKKLTDTHQIPVFLQPFSDFPQPSNSDADSDYGGGGGAGEGKDEGKKKEGENALQDAGDQLSSQKEDVSSNSLHETSVLLRATDFPSQPIIGSNHITIQIPEHGATSIRSEWSLRSTWKVRTVTSMAVIRGSPGLSFLRTVSNEGVLDPVVETARTVPTNNQNALLGGFLSGTVGTTRAASTETTKEVPAPAREFDTVELTAGDYTDPNGNKRFVAGRLIIPRPQQQEKGVTAELVIKFKRMAGAPNASLGCEFQFKSHHWINLRTEQPVILGCAFALFSCMTVPKIYAKEGSKFDTTLDLHGSAAEASAIAEGSSNVARSVGVAILGRGQDAITSLPAHRLRRASIAILSGVGRLFTASGRRAEKMKPKDTSKGQTTEQRHRPTAKEGDIEAQFFTLTPGSDVLTPALALSTEALPPPLDFPFEYQNKFDNILLKDTSTPTPRSDQEQPPPTAVTSI
ncbi:hypothetical protein T439DRAFT_382604 [Meredithblackwellia eburnea MCA 4105]